MILLGNPKHYLVEGVGSGGGGGRKRRAGRAPAGHGGVKDVQVQMLIQEAGMSAAASAKGVRVKAGIEGAEKKRQLRRQWSSKRNWRRAPVVKKKVGGGEILGAGSGWEGNNKIKKGMGEKVRKEERGMMMMKRIMMRRNENE